MSDTETPEHPTPAIKIVPKEQSPVLVDDRAKNEATAIAGGNYDDIERSRQMAEAQTVREANLDLKINRRLRWKYAGWVFCYLVGYSAVVGALLVFSGFGIFGFSLPESVLSFLVGSTAASAIGLVLAVTHGLFNRK